MRVLVVEDDAQLRRQLVRAFEMTAAFDWGRRLDETVAGSALGLAVVAEPAERMAG